MSLFRSTVNTVRSSLQINNPLLTLLQVRTATKKVSGSKTNKNDSAGRRLGPKVYESHFVKPGQIIMRQRGTKIHPGENCGIGKDHTIFALEPGYVRFYYDPFHPLRKYVGVALKKSLTLPTPHFEPRVRRFGYEQITNSEEALKEESHMSRKEYLQQPEITKQKQKALKRDELLLKEIKDQINSSIKLEDSDIDIAANKLLNVYKLTKLGKSLEEANLQANYYYLYELQMSTNKGEISEDKLSELKGHYFTLSEKLDTALTVDVNGKVCKYLSPDERLKEREDILSTLSKDFGNKLIKKADKEAIENLIKTPLIFSKSEQSDLLKEYLPDVLPETVEETVISDVNTKKPPKGVTLVRKFDNHTREIITIGRTKDAYVA